MTLLGSPATVIRILGTLPDLTATMATHFAGD